MDRIQGVRDTYSFFTTNILLEILKLIEYIILGTTSRSQIDELKELVDDTVLSKISQYRESIGKNHDAGIKVGYEEKKRGDCVPPPRINPEVLTVANRISKNANIRKHYVTKDVDYDKANKSRRKDGYAAANV